MFYIKISKPFIEFNISFWKHLHLTKIWRFPWDHSNSFVQQYIYMYGLWYKHAEALYWNLLTLKICILWYKNYSPIHLLSFQFIISHVWSHTESSVLLWHGPGVNITTEVSIGTSRKRSIWKNRIKWKQLIGTTYLR